MANNKGWVCPKCGRSLAPWMSECPCYKNIQCSNTPLYSKDVYSDDKGFQHFEAYDEDRDLMT